MVPVLFMPAVMAAEEVGAGREELEDFDEAADGEPVLMADACALVEGNSNAAKFFLVADIGGGRGRGPRGPSGVWAPGALPGPDRGTCRRLALVADHRDLDRNKRTAHYP
jgi:hypothetical protein